MSAGSKYDETKAALRTIIDEVGSSDGGHYLAQVLGLGGDGDGDSGPVASAITVVADDLETFSEFLFAKHPEVDSTHIDRLVARTRCLAVLVRQIEDRAPKGSASDVEAVQ